MQAQSYRRVIASQVGAIEITVSDSGIRSVHFLEAAPDEIVSERHPLLDAAVWQLEEYFDGQRTRFNLPLDMEGTVFQQSVWEALLNIPYGTTSTYGEMARQLGDTRAVRAVGRANGRNPVAIIVPCHRVIGSGGKLIGYGGGLWRKEWLLRHEGSLLV